MTPQEKLVHHMCAEVDVEIIPANRYPVPGQTRALQSMVRILNKHGEGHLRIVLSTLAETEGNQGLIDETSLWAVSDLVRACPEWIENRAAEWLSWWDKLPLGWLMASVSHLRGVSHQRHALAGAVYYNLCVLSRQAMGGKDTTRQLKDAVPELKKSHRNRQRAIETGRRLLGIKASLGHGEWLTWVNENAGMSYATAKKYMKMAEQHA